MDTVPTFYLRNVSTPRASRVRRVNKDASNNGKQRGSLVKLLCGKCARVCCVLLLDKHCPTFCTTWVFPNVRSPNGRIGVSQRKRCIAFQLVLLTKKKLVSNTSFNGHPYPGMAETQIEYAFPICRDSTPVSVFTESGMQIRSPAARARPSVFREACARPMQIWKIRTLKWVI